MTAYEETLTNISLDAHADLVLPNTAPPHVAGTNPSGVQYRFVRISGPHQCNLFDGTESGDIPIGVLQNKPQVESQAATVAILGVSLVEAGGEIAAGAGVGSDATGRAVTGGALGVAVYGADEAGVLIPVVLRIAAAAVPD